MLDFGARLGSGVWNAGGAELRRLLQAAAFASCEMEAALTAAVLSSRRTKISKAMINLFIAILLGYAFFRRLDLFLNFL